MPGPPGYYGSSHTRVTELLSNEAQTATSYLMLEDDDESTQEALPETDRQFRDENDEMPESFIDPEPEPRVIYVQRTVNPSSNGQPELVFVQKPPETRKHSSVARRLEEGSELLQQVEGSQQIVLQDGSTLNEEGFILENEDGTQQVIYHHEGDSMQVQYVDENGTILDIQQLESTGIHANEAEHVEAPQEQEEEQGVYEQEGQIIHGQDDLSMDSTAAEENDASDVQHDVTQEEGQSHIMQEDEDQEGRAVELLLEEQGDVSQEEGGEEEGTLMYAQVDIDGKVQYVPYEPQKELVVIETYSDDGKLVSRREVCSSSTPGVKVSTTRGRPPKHKIVSSQDVKPKVMKIQRPKVVSVTQVHQDAAQSEEVLTISGAEFEEKALQRRNYNQKRGPRLIQDFLLPHLDNETFGERLKWIDRSQGIFAVGWCHKNGAEWKDDDCVVFQEWDRLKQRPVGVTPQYWMEAKQRFRSALMKVSYNCVINSPEYRNMKVCKIKWTRETRPTLLSDTPLYSNYYDLPPPRSFEKSPFTGGMIKRAMGDGGSNKRLRKYSQNTIHLEKLDVQDTEQPVEIYIETTSDGEEVMIQSAHDMESSDAHHGVAHEEKNTSASEHGAMDVSLENLVAQTVEGSEDDGSEAAAAVLSSRFFTERNATLKATPAKGISRKRIHKRLRLLAGLLGFDTYKWSPYVKPKLKYRCVRKKCNFVTSNRKLFLRHQLIHRGKPHFACSHCTLKFRIPETLFAHLQQVHHTSGVICVLCSSDEHPARKRADLSSREVANVQQQLKMCKRCGAVCSRRMRLLRHLAVVHSCKQLKKKRKFCVVRKMRWSFNNKPKSRFLLYTIHRVRPSLLGAAVVQQDDDESGSKMTFVDFSNAAEMQPMSTASDSISSATVVSPRKRQASERGRGRPAKRVATGAGAGRGSGRQQVLYTNPVVYAAVEQEEAYEGQPEASESIVEYPVLVDQNGDQVTVLDADSIPTSMDGQQLKIAFQEQGDGYVYLIQE